jgi:VCBS repeat-containing protein
VATVSLTVTPVNDAPVAVAGTASGAEDTVINGSVAASDIDSSMLTYSLVQPASHGTVSLNPDGSYSYTPGANYAGADSFSFTASDGSLDSNVATVSLTVTPVNDAPVAVAGTASGAEDTVINGSVAASDIDSSTLTYSLVQPASHGTVSLNPDGSYSYTPGANYAGADSFSFTASDGSLDSNVATVSLTVTPVNDAPVAVAGTASGAEDTVINGSVAASDIDSSMLTYSLVQPASHGTVSLNPDGSYSYTPGANYAGADSFSFTASDGSLDSNVATVSLTVTPVNDAPVAVAGTASGAEDTVINGSVAASDIDSSMLTYSLVQPASHGTVSLNPDGSYSYTPGANYAGADSFSFTASDGSLDSNVATVSLTVTPVNDAPVAVAGTASGAEDTVINGSVAASDIDSSTLTYSLVQPASHGTVSLNPDGSYSYTPGANYAGADSFSFTASDGSLDSNVATVSLTVTPVNDAPVAVAGTASGAEDTVINGSVAASDIDSSTLTYSLVQPASHGTVSLNPDGSYSYTPGANYAGADSFSFTASDGSLDSNVATVSLTVTPVNDAPVAVAGTASGAEDTVINGSVAASDIDSSTLTYSLVQPASHGTVSLNPDGSYSYTPGANYAGADSFSFTASDGSLDSNVATVSLTVTPVNDALSGSLNVAGELRQGQALTLLSFSVDDPDGNGPTTVAWLREGRPIEGANGNSYLLVAADVGSTISVEISYTDGEGNLERMRSGSTDIVLATNAAAAAASPTFVAFQSAGGTTDVTAASNTLKILTGTSGDDKLLGTGGTDIFTPSLGNDSIDAGAGQDTVVLPMFPNVYDLSEDSAGHVIGAYAGNTLVLNDVEFVQFGTTYQTNLPLSELVSGHAQSQLALLTDLYLAFFGRPPDVTGLEFWQEKLLEDHWSLTALAIEFAWSTEAQALFPPTASTREFVRSVYVNCFGREPDASGWDYWAERLDGLAITDLDDRGAFVGEFIQGAYAPTSGEDDRALLAIRHDAALYYVNKLAINPSEGFDPAISALLARVTGDAGTEDRAEDVIDHAFANPVTLTGVMTDQTLLDSIWGG